MISHERNSVLSEVPIQIIYAFFTRLSQVISLVKMVKHVEYMLCLRHITEKYSE